jgi:endonuclease/exonuclease/phosphatase (EEP) superfamily protein YafD
MQSQLILCKCGKAITVPAHHRGRKIRCRECGRVMRAGTPVHPVVRALSTPFVAAARMVDRVVARYRPQVYGQARTGTRERAAGAIILQSRAELFVSRGSWAYLAAIVVITIMLWQFGDAWWPMTPVLFLGRWIVLLPLVVLVPAAAIRQRGLLVPLGIAALLALGPFMGLRTGWRRLLPLPEGTPVRVMTFNAGASDHFAFQLEALADEWDPDFIALQECTESVREAAHEMTGWYFHEVRQLCFASRHPILESKVMDRSGLASVHGEEDGGIGGSGDVVLHSVKLPSGVINITNLHLETPRKGLAGLLNGSFDVGRLRENTKLRDIESSLARRWVANGTGPTLVVGDFNTPVESRIFRRQWGHLKDAFSYAGTGFGMTKLNGWIRVRIDHVLYGPGWHVKKISLLNALESDHRPMIVDFILTPGQ